MSQNTAAARRGITTDAKTEPAEWTPPTVRLGQKVLWHHGQSWKEAGAENKPSMAFITEPCSGGRVRLAILSVDSTTFTCPDDPVPHKNDPQLARLIASDPDAGVWEECPAEDGLVSVDLFDKLAAAVASRVATVDEHGRQITELKEMLDLALSSQRQAA